MASSRPVSTIVVVFNGDGALGSVTTGGSSYTLTATATPAAGCFFVRWELVSYAGTCQDINGRISGWNTTTLTVDNSEEEYASSGRLTVRAVFSATDPSTPTTYTLTTSVSPNAKAGTISPSGTNTYNAGTSVTVTASERDSAYRFSHLLVDGSVNSSQTVTLTMNQDHTVVAYFTLKYHGILYSPSEGGSIIHESGDILRI